MDNRKTCKHYTIVQGQYFIRLFLFSGKSCLLAPDDRRSEFASLQTFPYKKGWKCKGEKLTKNRKYQRCRECWECSRLATKKFKNTMIV